MPPAKPKIIVIDDMIELTHLLEVAFRPHFNVAVEHTLKSGMRALTSNGEFDCVILDLVFTETASLPALTALHEVKRAAPATPVIVITGAGDGDMHEAFEAGALGFLEKPFDYDVLIRLVYDVIAMGAPYRSLYREFTELKARPPPRRRLTKTQTAIIIAAISALAIIGAAVVTGLMK